MYSLVNRAALGIALLALATAPARGAACSTVASGSTALEKAANGLGAQEWCEFTPGLIASDLYPGSCTGKSVLEWLGNGYWDPVNKIAGFIGAAHSSNPETCSDMAQVYYNDATDTWTEAYGGGIPHGTPSVAQHGNDNTTVDPSTGYVYFVSNRNDTLYRAIWNGSTYDWDSTLASYPDTCQNADDTTGVGWDNTAGHVGIVTVSDHPVPGRMCFWDRDTDVWSIELSSVTGYSDGFDAKVVCSDQDDGCWVHDVYGSVQSWKNLSGVITQNADAPEQLGCCGSTANLADTDPVTGKFVTSSKASSFATWREYTLSTDTWAAISHSMPPMWSAAGAMQNTSISISTYGVIMYVDSNNFAPKIYLYKHSAFSTTPACQDGIDNDGDGMIDLLDPSCADASDGDEDDPGSAFETNCKDASAVRCYSFEDQTDMETGHPQGAKNCGGVAPSVRRIEDPSGGIGDCTLQSSTRCWDLDAATKATGKSALRMEIPDLTGSDTSGSFALNFSDDYTQVFGEGEEFYARFRYRMNSDMNRNFTGGDGFKVDIVGTGDYTGNCGLQNSCTDLELVMQTSTNWVGPFMYHTCGVVQNFCQYTDVPFCSGQLINQHYDNPPYCCFNSFPGGCWAWPSDQWMTVQYHVSIGTWNVQETSRVRIWVSTEGGAKELIFDTDISGARSAFKGKIINDDTINHKYGKIWLLPYNTNKDNTEVHNTGYVWYDDLIISTTDLWGTSGSITGLAVSGVTIR